MLNTRASGVLMHLSSLPSPYGIGVMGEETKRFIRKIKDMGFSYWQVLPLNPPDFYGSPYASNAAFAISYLFIDPRGLVRDRLVKEDELSRSLYHGSPYTADFEFAANSRLELLKLAYSRISSEMHKKIEEFCNAHHWCEAYTLYGAAKERFGGKPWYEWDEPFARYETAVQHADELKAAQDFFKFVQYTAFTQWREIKQYANENGVKILGDMPIYVSFDSADVWENRHLFEIDDRTFIRKRVSGVPPDYFSEDGQLWGNPLYDWVAMEKDNYRWWCERIRAALQLYDTVRIDHFRAFASYWAVPADSDTAKNGVWEKGPGKALFDAVENELGEVPIVAEDLGVFGEDVVKLLEDTKFPACASFSSALSRTRTAPTFRTTTRATALPMSARTTTTPCSRGFGRRTTIIAAMRLTIADSPATTGARAAFTALRAAKSLKPSGAVTPPSLSFPIRICAASVRTHA